MNTNTPKNNTYRYTRLAAFALIGLFAFAGTTAAQSPIATTNGAWWQHNLGTQLATLIDSPIAAQKQRGLQHIMYFATSYGDQVDLKATLPSLLAMYKNDRDEGFRIMALSALQVIGDEDSMHTLLDRVDLESSPRVRRLTLAMLADHARQDQSFRADLARVATLF